ncbi:MAG: 3-oxoacyl-ACP reductase FabG [Anaerolineae bacterium]|nr:3-oxoacyl-ACP reductase FabG [Anaerolineae bacterium]
MPYTSDNIFSLLGRVAVVTGAAGGLGRAFCLVLAAAGARLVAADLSEVGAKQTAEAVTAAGGEAIAVGVDVTNPAGTERMAATALDRWGRVDILVNNAGLYATLSRRPFYELPPEEWDRVMAVNLKGPWLCARAVYPAMKKQGYGKIINIVSATFFSGSPLWSHYVASKGGLIGLTRSMAREVGDDGICVNAIAPGFTLTDASRSVMPNAEDYGVARGAIKRAEQPDDIAGLVVFLASDASSFITGQTMVVDGGRQLY